VVTVPTEPVHEPVSPRRRIVRAVLEVSVMGVAFYFVLPRVIDAFSAFPELSRVGIGWIVVVLACEVTSFLMVWMLLRLATRTTQWLAVATAQFVHQQLQMGG